MWRRGTQLTLATYVLMLCAVAAHAGGIITAESLGNGEYFVTGISGTLFGAPVSLLPTTNPVANPDPSQCPVLSQFYEEAASGFEFDDIAAQVAALRQPISTPAY